MFLRSLYLHNFRIFGEEEFSFHPHLNYIYGSNAQGKTTLLEAIHFLMMGRSFRTQTMRDLIQKGTDSCYLEAKFIKFGVEQRVKVTCRGTSRHVVYNDTVCPSYTSLLGMIQGVVITPDDVILVKGSPKERRHYLDIQIAQSDPLYVHHLTRYLRAMRYRNHLLRARQLVTIESWEHEMARSAAYVTLQRKKAVLDLEKRSANFYSLFSEEADRLRLFYRTGIKKIETEEALSHYFLEQYQKSRSKEMLIGSTFIGPHKDDIVMTLGEKEVRIFASEGQKRSVVISLKFAEWERLQAVSDEAPLMLLDDIGMGLDEKRQARIFGYFPHLRQVFLTSTENNPTFDDCQRIKIQT